MIDLRQSISTCHKNRIVSSVNFPIVLVILAKLVSGNVLVGNAVIFTEISSPRIDIGRYCLCGQCHYGNAVMLRHQNPIAWDAITHDNIT